jgi:hypothetical protein
MSVFAILSKIIRTNCFAFVSYFHDTDSDDLEKKFKHTHTHIHTHTHTHTHTLYCNVFRGQSSNLLAVKNAMKNLNEIGQAGIYYNFL